MVVMVLIAVASAMVSFSLRDPAASRLDHEGARLDALLEAARIEARASGLVASWEPRAAQEGAEGFQFIGLPKTSELPSNWLTPGITVDIAGARAVLLGPEPLIGAQKIVLHLNDQSLTVETDGLGPFIIASDAASTSATAVAQ